MTQMDVRSNRLIELPPDRSINAAFDANGLYRLDFEAFEADRK
jgi:hypothetical protein